MATENFLTYPETDPNSRITVTQDRVSWTDLTRNEVAYVYSDKGANYFDGNFVHLLTIRSIGFTAETATANNRASFWALANLINDYDGIRAASGDAIGVFFRMRETGSIHQILLWECDGGTGYLATEYTITANTNYYLKIVRDENVGTYGTIYCYTYSDAARTVLVNTQSIALHTSKKDFRYIYALQTVINDANTYKHTGYAEVLTIEGGTASVLPEVSQQSPTSVAATTVTGNGYISSLGLSSVTEHGHCWNTTGTPTTADSKTTNGAGSLGAFTSAITGLTPGTKYYIRAYATNSYGTAYSNGISLVSGSSSVIIFGNIAVVETRLHYIGTDGKEYYLQGTAV